MEIGLYEDWMKPQVARLFSMQYGVKEEDFAALIGNFYENEYQAGKCIRIIAKEGEQVIGFQSFFYWPYRVNNTDINAYQSGNSLVHPEHRGKGIFQKLLDYVELHREELKIDVLMGFPINASVGSLIRNKWLNLLNLKWYLRFVSLLSVLKPADHPALERAFSPLSRQLPEAGQQDVLRLKNENTFQAWRKKLYPQERYYSFYYSGNGQEALFELRLNIRKKAVKELIIGSMSSSSYSADFVSEALKALVRKARSTGSITIVSMAINEDFRYSLKGGLGKAGFRKIKKEIYFCVKPFVPNPLLKAKESWDIYRADIDTW